MKKYFFIYASLIFVFFNSCTNGKAQKYNLTPIEFADKIKELPEAPLLDVRTPDEFSAGHLEKAQNIDWNGADFIEQIEKLDKSKPIFVYCLSGGRSGQAATKMRSLGFEQVFELSGGIMKWRSEQLPEAESSTAAVEGYTMAQYEALLNSDKLVLVDVYAEWCGPCKKMKPFLDEISKEMADKVVIIRIDADKNKALCESLGVEGLPTLKLYKNKTLVWDNLGFVTKEVLLEKLK